MDQNIVLEVIDVGHYMILPADYLAPDLIRCIATECGVDIDEDPEAMIIDHINYDSTLVEGDHTLIAGDDLIQSALWARACIMMSRWCLPTRKELLSRLSCTSVMSWKWSSVNFLLWSMVVMLVSYF